MNFRTARSVAGTLATAGILSAACGSHAPLQPSQQHGALPQPAPVANTDLTGSCAAAPSPPASAPDGLPSGTVSHAGRWLTDGQGRVLLLHGVNEVVMRPPYAPCAIGIGDADGAWLAANGFELVRLGVSMAGLAPTPRVINTSYLDQIAATVTMLGRHHIYTLLDFHQDNFTQSLSNGDGFPGWMALTHGAKNTNSAFQPYATNPAVAAAFQSFWDDTKGPNGSGLQEDYLAMLYAVAKRFAHDPWVLGYDLLNEPWPGTTWTPCLSPQGCPALDMTELMTFYDKADSVLREVDNAHLVFEEPFVTFNLGNGPTSISLPLKDHAVGMSFHEYALTSDHIAPVLANALAWSQRTGGALLDTEFGASGDIVEVNTHLEAIETNLLPWIYWTFSDCITRCKTRHPGEALLSDPALPPEGANLNGVVATLLVQAHPVAVAGAPTSYSYDPVRAVLTFSWSTARANGGAFAPGTVTAIAAPARAYPSGYRVQVAGATVVSSPCAPVLELANAPGAASASVTVSPGGPC